MSTVKKNKRKVLEIKHDGKTYKYDFHSIKSLPAETANEIMQWYNDAKSRQKDVNLKDIQRSDLGEVKDAIVAHLVREVSDKKVMLPYDPNEARDSIKNFMHELPSDKFSEIKDEIIRDFFLGQGKLHLATLILRDKPKQSLTAESIQLLGHLMTASKNSTESQEKKSSESPLSKVAN